MSELSCLPDSSAHPIPGGSQYLLMATCFVIVRADLLLFHQKPVKWQKKYPAAIKDKKSPGTAAGRPACRGRGVAGADPLVPLV